MLADAGAERLDLATASVEVAPLCRPADRREVPERPPDLWESVEAAYGLGVDSTGPNNALPISKASSGDNR